MLFEEQTARKPNLYPWTQDFIDSIWAGFWTPNEFDFKSDLAQFHKDLTDEERDIITKTLSAIGQIEIAVKRFWAQLGEHLPHPSMSDLGYAMANSEVIHNQAYEKLLDVLHLGHIFEENLKIPVVANRVKYLRKYLQRVYKDDRKQYVYAIILFTLFVENVSLFSQFYIILWFNRYKALLKDTSQQVQYTRNEEALHAQVGIKLIQTLRAEYPDLFDDRLIKRVMDECLVAFESECQIIDWIMGDFKQDNLSAEHLKAYIQNRLVNSLRAIGIPSPFTEIDLEVLDETYWMDEELLGNNMTDFFAKKPVDYAKKQKPYSVDELF